MVVTDVLLVMEHVNSQRYLAQRFVEKVVAVQEDK